jgi:glycosyltransferase involved in cell wall biosynthesis
MIQFSIIIPTRNRPQPLIDCLKSLAQIGYPRDRFEVIVVDDSSDTPLDTVTNPFQEQLVLRLMRQKNAGPAAAFESAFCGNSICLIYYPKEFWVVD